MTDLSGYTDAQLKAFAGDLDPDTDALVRTVWGEARNQPPVGRKAVAAVIRNRSKLSGAPVRDVVLAPGQFEPWGNPQTRQQLESLDPTSDAYQTILADIEDETDPTGGATHFYAPKAQAALGRKPPQWDDGSGSDIGDHRFFKLSYGGGQPAPTSQPEPPPLEDLSDEELEAIAQEPVAAEPAPEPAADPIEGVEFTAMPKTAMGARKATVVSADDNSPATPAQEAFYVGQVKAGALDPAKVRAGGYRAGSEEFPLLQRSPDDLPKPGDWYVTPEGEKRQVPDVPMLDTALNLGRMATMPGLGAVGLPDDAVDPRSAAMRRAIQSGVMLGGRNELMAGIESIPAMFEGGVPLLKERFGDVLEREDVASAKARRDFPIAYDASAVTGALTSGGVLPVGRLATAGVGAGSGFLATDGDLKDRAIGAGIGAVGGEVVRAIAPRIGGAVADLVGVPRRVGEPQMAAAAEALRAQGVQIDTLPPLARARLERELRAGAEPADAAMLALNDALPVEVPFRRGDVTGLPTDQIEFNMNLRGARGAGPAADAQDIVARQQDALRLNVDEIASGIRNPIGRGEIPMRGEGGRLVSEALTAQREAQRKSVTQAYEAARESGGGTILPREQVPVLAARLRESVRDYDLERVPAVGRALSRLDDVGGATEVRDIFAVRSQLSSLRASSDAVERSAAGAATKELDAYLNDAVEQSLFSGDQEAIGAWRKAIQTRREMAEAFDQGDLADKLTRSEGTGSARRLAVDPEEAANYIFGRSALGLVGRKNLYRDLEKVRGMLGADSEPWNALRAEAFVRMAGAGEGAMDGAAQQFSGVKFAKAWQKANTEDQRLVSMLFTQEERARIDAFAGVAARVTSSAKGGDNPSNTAAAMKYLSRLATSTFAVGKAVPLLRDALVGIEEIATRAAARSANRPTPRRVPTRIPMRQAPGAAGGYTGATAASEEPIY